MTGTDVVLTVIATALFALTVVMGIEYVREQKRRRP